MATATRRAHYSYEEYLALEEESAIRHEFFEGQIYAMAGGSPDHAALAGSLIGLLRPGLPRGCRVFTSDLRIRIPSTGLSTYPDAAVVCGRSQRAPDDPLAVVNPVLLVEVTSRSTESYDRGEKLEQYKQLPSVREILIVSHQSAHLTLHRRGDDGHWSVTEARAGERIELGCLAAHLDVDALYLEGLEDAET